MHEGDADHVNAPTDELTWTHHDQAVLQERFEALVYPFSKPETIASSKANIGEIVTADHTALERVRKAANEGDLLCMKAVQWVALKRLTS